MTEIDMQMRLERVDQHFDDLGRLYRRLREILVGTEDREPLTRTYFMTHGNFKEGVSPLPVIERLVASCKDLSVSPSDILTAAFVVVYGPGRRRFRQPDNDPPPVIWRHLIARMPPWPKDNSPTKIASMFLAYRHVVIAYGFGWRRNVCRQEVDRWKRRWGPSVDAYTQLVGEAVTKAFALIHYSVRLPGRVPDYHDDIVSWAGSIADMMRDPRSSKKRPVGWVPNRKHVLHFWEPTAEPLWRWIHRAVHGYPSGNPESSDFPKSMFAPHIEAAHQVRVGTVEFKVCYGNMVNKCNASYIEETIAENKARPEETPCKELSLELLPRVGDRLRGVYDKTGSCPDCGTSYDRHKTYCKGRENWFFRTPGYQEIKRWRCTICGNLYEIDMYTIALDAQRDRHKETTAEITAELAQPAGWYQRRQAERNELLHEFNAFPDQFADFRIHYEPYRAGTIPEDMFRRRMKGFSREVEQTLGHRYTEFFELVDEYMENDSALAYIDPDAPNPIRALQRLKKDAKDLWDTVNDEYQSRRRSELCPLCHHIKSAPQNPSRPWVYMPLTYVHLDMVSLQEGVDAMPEYDA